MKKSAYVFFLLVFTFASSSATAANVAFANLHNFIQNGTITNDIGSTANITKIVYSLGAPGDGIATWQLSQGSGAGDESDFLSDPDFYQTVTFNGLNVSAGSNFGFTGLDIDLIETLAPLSVTGTLLDLAGSSLVNATLSIFWSDGSIGKTNLVQQAWTATQNLTVSGNPSAVPVPAAVWLFGSGLLGLLSLRRKSKFTVN